MQASQLLFLHHPRALGNPDSRHHHLESWEANPDCAPPSVKLPHYRRRNSGLPRGTPLAPLPIPPVEAPPRSLAGIPGLGRSEGHVAMTMGASIPPPVGQCRLAVEPDRPRCGRPRARPIVLRSSDARQVGGALPDSPQPLTPRPRPSSSEAPLGSAGGSQITDKYESPALSRPCAPSHAPIQQPPAESGIGSETGQGTCHIGSAMWCFWMHDRHWGIHAASVALGSCMLPD